MLEAVREGLGRDIFSHYDSEVWDVFLITSHNLIAYTVERMRLNE